MGLGFGLLARCSIWRNDVNGQRRAIQFPDMMQSAGTWKLRAGGIIALFNIVCEKVTVLSRKKIWSGTETPVEPQRRLALV